MATRQAARKTPIPDLPGWSLVLSPSITGGMAVLAVDPNGDTAVETRAGDTEDSISRATGAVLGRARTLADSLRRFPVRCPVCSFPPGSPCKTRGGHSMGTRMHSARVDLLRGRR